MAQVFVSYARQDRGTALPIIKALGRAGLRVWDDEAIVQGELLTEQLQAAIDAGQCVLLLWSRAAAESPFVQQEIHRAVQAWSSGRLVLAALDDTPLPVGLRDLSTVPIHGAGESETKQLIERVRTVVGEASVVRPVSPIEAAHAPAPRARGRWVIPATVLVLAAVAMTAWMWPSYRSAVPPQSSPPPVPQLPMSPMDVQAPPLPHLPPPQSPMSPQTSRPDLPPQSPTAPQTSPSDLPSQSPTASPDVRSDSYHLVLLIALTLTLGIAMGSGIVWLWNARSRSRSHQELPTTKAQSVTAGSDNIPQLFVSYSRQDERAVDQLVRELEQLGYVIWIDRQSTGSQRYAAPIVGAIRTSKLVALMCSQSAFASDHVIREVYVAGDYKKPFIAFQLDPTEFPDEILYFVSGFPRIPVAKIDPQQLRSEIARLIAA